MFVFVILTLFYFLCILMLNIINFRPRTKSCKSFFKRRIKNVSYLSKQINMLDALISVPENKTSVDILCSNSSRISDMVYSVQEKCVHCNMELSIKQWSALQEACLNITKINNGCFNGEDVEDYIKNRGNDFNLYAYSALPLVMQITILEQLQSCVTRLVDKQRKIRRINRILHTCGRNSLRDEVIFDAEQIYNLLFCIEDKEHAGYASLLDEAVMYHGMSLKAICDKYRETNFDICKRVKNLFDYLVRSNIDVEKLCLYNKNAEYFNEIDHSYYVSDEETKVYYRMWLNRFCNSSAKTEREVLSRAREMSNNKNGTSGYPGYYLIGNGQRKLKKDMNCKVKCINELRNMNAMVFLLMYATSVLFLAFLLPHIFPLLVAVTVGILLTPFWLFISFRFNEAFFINKGDKIPALSLNQDMLTNEHKTVVVVPCLIGHIKKCVKMAEKLELCMLSNPGYVYALVCDYPPNKLKNEEKNIINSSIVDLINELNKKYGGGFCCFIRDNCLCNGVLMPKERKRGALLALCNYILNIDNEFDVFTGDAIKECKYIFTIDEDSVLPPGSVNKMQCAIAHPLSEGKNGKRYMIQPNIISSLPYRENSYFALLYMQDGLMPSYPSCFSGLFQLLFDYSPFGGKGIFDICGYLHASKNIPSNKILSHDQPEGDLLNCGFASTVQLAENVPQSVGEYLSRQHRWMRGDWQNLFYLLTSEEFSFGFKVCCIFNCITSLKEFFLVCGFLTILLLFPEYAFCYSIIAVLLIGFDFLRSFASFFIKLVNKKYVIGNGVDEIISKLKFFLIDIIMLPCKAVIQADAFLISVWRTAVTKKDLLQWGNDSGHNNNVFFTRYWASPFFGLLTLIFSIYNNILSVFTILIFGLFFCAPFIYNALSLDKTDKSSINYKVKMTEKEKYTLYSLAVRTMAFFIAGINKENNYLPPDNYQKDPYKGFCDRTSITNIGFGVLSIVNAYVMGLLPKHYVKSMLSKMIESIESLPCVKNCHYNWYNIKNKEKLSGFVSAVDSGNFCTCLLCASKLLMKNEYKDDFDIETSKKIFYILQSDVDISKSCNEQLSYLKNLDINSIKEFLYHFDIEQCGNIYTKKIMAAWQEALYINDVQFHDIAQRLEAVARKEDLSFLYDGKKKLFYIGYDEQTHKYTESHYDLLASENLLCSYFSICSGKVPSEHWYALGRKSVKIDGLSILCSWSGTAFETLMPHIFLDYGQESLLGRSARCVVDYNIKTAEDVEAPFGISESCCSEINSNGDYCYEAFGIGDIALDTKQTAPVFSPYASIMAIELRPKDVYDNLRKYVALGMADEYGLYESVDFRYQPAINVKCYMSHHQGMIMASLCNFLCDGSVRNAFMGCLDMKAGSLLLHEQVPKFAEIKLKNRNYASGDCTSEIRTNAARLIWDKCILDVTKQGFGLFFDDFTVIPLGLYQHQKSGRFYYYNGERTFNVNWSLIEAGLSFIKCACIIDGVTIECEFLPIMSSRGLLLNIKFEGEVPLNAELIMCADIILNEDRHYYAHPSYSNLFIQASKKKDIAYCTSSRKGGELNGAVAVKCFNNNTQYYVMGEHIKPRNIVYGIDPIDAKDYRTSFEPVLAFRYKIAKQQNDLKAIINVGYGIENVINEIESVKIDVDEIRLAAVEMSKDYIKKYKLDSHEILTSLRIAQPLILGTKNVDNYYGSADILYKLGISGEKKIIAFVFDASETEQLYDNIKCVSILAKENADLVFLPTEPLTKDAEDEIRNHVLKNNYGNILNFAIINEHQNDYKALAHAVIYCSDIASSNVINSVKLQVKNDFEPSYINNALSGFYQDGYYISKRTPMPWCNVLSNGKIGCILGENGGGYSFADNSALKRLTAPSDGYRNDASEIVYVQNSDKDIWSITSYPIDRGDDHLTKHGYGYTEYYYNGFGIEAKQTVFTDANDECKYYKIDISNRSNKKQSLKIGIYVNAFIGQEAKRDKKYCAYYAYDDHAVCKRENDCVYIMGGDEYGVCSESFLGKSFNLSEPELSCSKYGRPDCLCAVRNIELNEDEVRQIFFCLSKHFMKMDDIDVNEKFNEVKDFYNGLLNTVEFFTGSDDVDLFLSKWVPYQTYNSRFLARCGFYQASGGFGYRDQLQDCLCLMYYDENLVREHILRCASHQYEYGDVQHWWHNDTLGVRSGFSDDRLWLIYVTCKYVGFTGDACILDEKRPYLIGKNKPVDQWYGDAVVSESEYSLYDHCKRALLSVMNNGEHGLPLILSGDWNDAMDEIGAEGRGESVWLAWFILTVADLFEPYMTAREDKELIDKVNDYCVNLLHSIEKFAWKGDRYLRAITDNGYEIGDESSSACKIDAISQAWAVISGFCDGERGNICIKRAYELLYDKKLNILKLFWPPFNHDVIRVGYINDYPEGVRENGGQYSHGTVWLAKALAIYGYADEAWNVLKCCMPFLLDDDKLIGFGNEPYVVSADVYSDGRGGWSWYTGAAGWIFTTVIEDIFGIKINGDTLKIQPCMPSEISKAKVILKKNGAKIIIEYKNPFKRAGGNRKIYYSGRLVEEIDIKKYILSQDDEYKITVVV